MKPTMLFFIIITVLSGHAPDVSPAVKAPEKMLPSLTADMTEIIFPFKNEAVTVEIQNGDIEKAQFDAIAILANMVIKQCEWKNPVTYYEDKVTIEILVTKTSVSVRARMDKSLCPEKK